jgi:DNA-binding beta-propeller fold protein YncE
LATVETIEVEGTLGDSIALLGDRLFYSLEVRGRASIGAYDLTTGVNDRSAVPSNSYWAQLRTSPALPGRLLIGEAGLSPASIEVWDVSGAAPTELARTGHGDIGSNLGDFGVSEDGTRIWVASGSPYEITEVRTSDLQLSGKAFPTGPYPQAVDSTVVSGVEMIAAGRDALEPGAYVFDAANPAAVTSYDVQRPGLGDRGVADRGIGFSSDGSRVFAVIDNFDGSNLATITRSTGAVTHAPLFPETGLTGLIHDMGELGIDPDTGRVFVTAFDSVAVYNPDGTFRTMLSEAGPRGMAFSATAPT